MMEAAMSKGGRVCDVGHAPGMVQQVFTVDRRDG